MASPQAPYEDGAPDAEGGQAYAQDGTYDQQQQAGQASAPGGRKKGRAYASNAYDIGAGQNAALGGQQPGGAQFPGSPAPATPGAGGYGYPSQQQQQQQPSYGMPQQPPNADPNAPAAAQGPYGQGQGQGQYAAPQQGGYEPPAASYPAHGATSILQQGVQGVTQQFSQMGIGGGQAQPQQQQPQQPPQGQMRLNPLQPVDISMQGQPFDVNDLDAMPPPIILPPNVSLV